MEVIYIMNKKDKPALRNIKCECGYQNHEINVKRYGTCTGCGKVLDERVYFKRQMNKKLRLWRGKLK